MADTRYALLDPLRFPLVARFYKTHYPAGKPKKDEIIWTAENSSGLFGSVRFRQFPNFQLLTGMLIAPEQRGKKQGEAFLNAVQTQIQTKACYCLAYRYLEKLYNDAGFEVIEVSNLPEELRGRYQSYCNSGKDLIPMRHNSMSQL